MIRNTIHPLITAPNTEQPIRVPTPLWRIRARAANGIPVRFSFNAGEVAGGGGVVLTGEPWDTSWMPRTGNTIYVASHYAGARAFIEVWSQHQVLGDVAAYDFGYTLGYES